MSQTTERAFETYVEEILLTRGCWRSGSHAAVERLQKFRTILMTAAVTGRIDVRAAVSAAAG